MEPAPPPDENHPHPAQKEPVAIEFDPDSSIPDRLPSFPAQFAIDKTKAKEYVELWYFTTEGIRDNSQLVPTISDDTFSLMQTDAGLALRQFKATKASRNAVEDEILTWEQIMTARHNMLDAASEWPANIRRSLAEFYMNLEAYKAAGNNTRALISYHAVARRRWYPTLKGTGDRFNIANINKNLLRDLKNRNRNRDHEEMQKQASNASPPRPPTSTLY